MTRKYSQRLHRPLGFSFLELQVSLLLLGIVLGAMVPLVMMQTKQLAFLEYRWDPDSGWQASLDYWIDPYHVSDEGPVYDLVTANIGDCTQINPWARKLGAPARLVPRSTTDPAVSSSAGGWSWLPEEAHNTVEIVTPTTERSVSITSDTASATVTVTPVSGEEEEGGGGEEEGGGGGGEGEEGGEEGGG